MNGVAVITGAGSGIGRASALGLSQAGWRVVLAGRRPEPLADLASSIGKSALALPTDVADSASVDGLFAETVERFGRVDLLFNNAGLSLPATRIDSVGDEDWDRLVEVNLSGAFRCLRAAFRVMRDQSPQGGRIINNGSISAHAPRLHSAAYTATKHAITGLTRSASLDGRELNIACGQIDIGNAATDMASGAVDGMLQADGSIRAEPVMNVDDVARAVVHMAELPLEANVQFMTIMATTMPFVGRG
ncbi:SDR family oxidoreductase [Aurantiacibacter odishensis]|uniref:SDR family oxidoreductase n=1 Tax=Aurantiacibacter odishensis TaxID=1155476 RepID=UPI000E711E53|nr:SDR family oxidoreductase [Aurantiacibacter odishensis]